MRLTPCAQRVCSRRRRIFREKGNEAVAILPDGGGYALRSLTAWSELGQGEALIKVKAALITGEAKIARPAPPRRWPATFARLRPSPGS